MSAFETVRTSPLRPRYVQYIQILTVTLRPEFRQHQSEDGANHTKKRLPVKLQYFEYYPHVYLAYNREKQIQKWSRKKKEALVNGKHKDLPELAKAYRDL
ncbi:GIY-YIG nuclease family protein [Lishizhenia sp.]|uniref:GIY-YIG nuclease family protein n=1 Tax=Lishizhenia sp. TaxID=2497594 RepID=UPI0039AF6C04